MKIFGIFFVLVIFAETVRCVERNGLESESKERSQRSVNMFLEKRRPPASEASKSEAASKEELSKKVPLQERHQATTNSEDVRQGKNAFHSLQENSCSNMSFLAGRLWRDSQPSYRDRRRSFYYG